jgi:hypothetical protein
MTTKGSKRRGRIDLDELSNLFEYRQGLHLKDTLLWFDSQRQRELCFVSHALVPGAFRHEKVLATEATSLLLRALAGAYGRGRQAHQPQLLVTPFHRTFSLGTLSLELFPSGYLLGSSSLLVTHRGMKIVYASTINPTESALVDRLEARHCDVLVLPCGTSGPAAAGQCESTVLPSPEEVTEQLLRFVETTLATKQLPILLCPPLGEAQLLVLLLQQAGHRLRVHRQIFAACGVYQELRPDALSIEQVRCYKRPIAASAGEVLLWPATLSSSEALLRHEQRRVALVSPRASDARLREELGAEAGFPISAAADYRGVLEYIDACQPVAVALTGSPSSALVDDLQAKGIHTLVVGPQKQLPLL